MSPIEGSVSMHSPHSNSITIGNGEVGNLGGCNNCNIWSHLKRQDYNDNQVSIIGTSQGFIENGRTTGSFTTYIVDSFVSDLFSRLFRDYFVLVEDIVTLKH